jgi:hypothetical protein
MPKQIAILIVLLAWAWPVMAQDVTSLQITEVSDQTIADYQWKSRPLIIFADSPLDPAFVRQITFLKARPTDLNARDVVILTDTNPTAMSALRSDLHPRGFSIVLIDKDGAVALRKPTPWETRELARVIDNSPIRLEELRQRRTMP